MLDQKDVNRPGTAIARFGHMFMMFESRNITLQPSPGSKSSLIRSATEYPVAMMSLVLVGAIKDIRIDLTLRFINYIATSFGMLLGGDHTSPDSIAEVIFQADGMHTITFTADGYSESGWLCDRSPQRDTEPAIFKKMMRSFDDFGTPEEIVEGEEECRVLSRIDECVSVLAKYRDEP